MCGLQTEKEEMKDKRVCVDLASCTGKTESQTSNRFFKETEAEKNICVTLGIEQGTLTGVHSTLMTQTTTQQAIMKAHK